MLLYPRKEISQPKIFLRLNFIVSHIGSGLSNVPKASHFFHFELKFSAFVVI